jgi:hypothetical protein
VGHVERGRTPLAEEVAEEPEPLLLQADVQVRERLVEQDRPRVHDERPSDGAALTLAAGQLAGMVPLLPSEADAAQDRGDPIVALAAPDLSRV